MTCGIASWNYRPTLYTTIKDTNSTWVGRLIQVLWGTVILINWWCAVMCSFQALPCDTGLQHVECTPVSHAQTWPVIAQFTNSVVFPLPVLIIEIHKIHMTKNRNPSISTKTQYHLWNAIVLNWLSVAKFTKLTAKLWSADITNLLWWLVSYQSCFVEKMRAQTRKVCYSAWTEKSRFLTAGSRPANKGIGKLFQLQ